MQHVLSRGRNTVWQPAHWYKKRQASPGMISSFRWPHSGQVITDAKVNFIGCMQIQKDKDTPEGANIRTQNAQGAQK
jgi:hypothetical protein